MTPTAARIAFASIFLALCAAPAAAQTGTVSAATGKSARVDAYMGWTDDCAHLPIDIDVVSPPQHGTLTPKFGTETIRKASIGQSNTCMGRKVKALILYYKSKKGYRGADRFQVRIAVGNQPATYNYVVNVR